MKLIAYPLAALLGFFGLMFVVGAQGQPMRIVVGVILAGRAGALVWLALQQPKAADHHRSCRRSTSPAT